jgi:hypothetical protein
MFRYSRDRKAIHPERHLANYSGILQAEAYAGFNGLYAPGRNRCLRPTLRGNPLIMSFAPSK